MPHLAVISNVWLVLSINENSPKPSGPRMRLMLVLSMKFIALPVKAPLKSFNESFLRLIWGCGIYELYFLLHSYTLSMMNPNANKITAYLGNS